MGKRNTCAHSADGEHRPCRCGEASERRAPSALREATEDPFKILRHDLRDSIGVILNTLVLLREETGMASGKTKTYLDMLNRQALKLEQILDQARFRLRTPRS
jgi:hypothetical protein